MNPQLLFASLHPHHDHPHPLVEYGELDLAEASGMNPCLHCACLEMETLSGVLDKAEMATGKSLHVHVYVYMYVCTRATYVRAR